MRVLVAFDKFKDSLTAPAACAIAADALRAVQPGWTFDLCPLADGGEGFREILTTAVGGRTVRYPVTAPRGGQINSPIGLVPLNQIPLAARGLLGLGDLPLPATQSAPVVALIEMAAASGLALLPPERRDPWHTTSQGTGQLIRAAAELHATAIVLGVGGSATHDLGLGALGALGLEYLTAGGEKVSPPLPIRWPIIARLAGGAFHSLPPIRIACDVTNPLLGPQGAAAVYGPQKGLQPEDFARLDGESRRLAVMLCTHCGQPESLMDVPGAGAAGGISFGLMAAVRAQLLPGFDLVGAWLDLDRRLAAADLIITGEGRFDDSSLSGKGPGAVAARALALGKRVQVFAGSVTTTVHRPGLALAAITAEGIPLEAALRAAPANLAAAVRNAFDGSG